MKKEDFKVGQTVWIYLIGNAARGKTEEERIEEWEVTSIGKKYIHAIKKGKNYGDERFDITKNFIHYNKEYSAAYELYLTKEELLKKLWRKETQNAIRICTSYGSCVLDALTDKDLKTVYDILKRYER